MPGASGADSERVEERVEDGIAEKDRDGQRVPGFDASAVDGGSEVRGCPQAFGRETRGRWFAISGQWYFVDTAGRPAAAVALLPPVVADDEREEDCQRHVGQWGDQEDPVDDYDGGHLIGYQLGGWGARANLVPQQAGFNRGNWAQVENALARCGALAAERIRYTVAVRYGDATALVPTRMEMRIEDTATYASLRLEFENATAGGPAGAAARRRAVDWLRAIGCQ